jgi:hypothetical protein
VGDRPAACAGAGRFVVGTCCAGRPGVGGACALGYRPAAFVLGERPAGPGVPDRRAAALPVGERRAAARRAFDRRAAPLPVAACRPDRGPAGPADGTPARLPDGSAACRKDGGAADPADGTAARFADRESARLAAGAAVGLAHGSTARLAGAANLADGNPACSKGAVGVRRLGQGLGLGWHFRQRRRPPRRARARAGTEARFRGLVGHLAARETGASFAPRGQARQAKPLAWLRQPL